MIVVAVGRSERIIGQIITVRLHPVFIALGVAIKRTVALIPIEMEEQSQTQNRERQRVSECVSE